MAPSIYLDHNSTSPIYPEVVAALHAAYQAGDVNPASQHQQGQQARRVLEATREAILTHLGGKTSGMQADRLLFTSGGTEANNLALRGLIGPAPGRIIVSAIEHPSVLATAEYLQSQGYQVDRIRVLATGEIDVGQAYELIEREPRPRLVSVMLANNETGVLQPLAQLATICHATQVPLHCDAVQAIGKVPFNFRELGLAAATIAAHKFGGPLGIGALVLRHDLKLEPQLFGGFQQDGLRPGTESVALAVGMRAALDCLHDRPPLAEFRAAFERQLQTDLPEIVINCREAPRLPNTSNIAFLGLHRQELLLALDMAGICCSTGSACASGSSEPSPVLLAMGLPAAVIESSLRFSFGRASGLADVDAAASRIIRVVNDLRRRANARKSPLSPRHHG